MGEILWFLIIFVCIFLPLILTLFNIINLFRKKKVKENLIDILTFLLGIILTITLYTFSGFKDYDKPIVLGGLEVRVHAPIASWSMPTVIAILVLGIVSYFLIRIKKLNLGNTIYKDGYEKDNLYLKKEEMLCQLKLELMVLEELVICLSKQR